jgi:hypothetical protein
MSVRSPVVQDDKVAKTPSSPPVRLPVGLVRSLSLTYREVEGEAPKGAGYSWEWVRI